MGEEDSEVSALGAASLDTLAASPKSSTLMAGRASAALVFPMAVMGEEDSEVSALGAASLDKRCKRVRCVSHPFFQPFAAAEIQ